jgi:hypothetical protein
VFVGACRHFSTVLGPGADMFHYDHFHMDLARHDARGTRRVCRPVLKFTPRLMEAGVATMSHGRFQPPADWARPAPRPQPRPGWEKQPIAEPDYAEEEPDGEALGSVPLAPAPPVRGRPMPCRYPLHAARGPLRPVRACRAPAPVGSAPRDARRPAARDRRAALLGLAHCLARSLCHT